jgi:hypothetical protein
MSGWWLGFPSAQATVTCGEHTHRLRWEAGELRAIDHDDLEGESTLAALGGQRCTCVEVIDAWRRHEDDPRVLLIASRGPADPIAAQADWTAQITAVPRAAPAPAAPASARKAPRRLLRGLARYGAGPPRNLPVGQSPLRPASAGRIPLKSQSESELVALLGLGGGLPDRLVATVAAAWAQRLAGGEAAVNGARPTLHASMHGRLSPAVRTWLGRADAEVRLELIDAGEEPALIESAGVIRAELPFDWLPEVWARGVAVVMGRFCLAARTEDGRAWTLTTVGPDLGAPAPVRMDMPAA